MSKHTQGPWAVKHSETKTAFNVIGTVLGGKYKIARCPYVLVEGADYLNIKQKAEAEANAQVIAAAPSMYEALKEFLKVINRSPAAMYHYGEAIEKGEAAIAKAEGKEVIEQ